MKKINLTPKYLQLMNIILKENNGFTIKSLSSGTSIRFVGGNDARFSFFDRDEKELMSCGRDGFATIDEHAYEDSNIDVLNEVEEKLEKEERIRSLELELAEKKEDINNLLRLLENCKNTIQNHEAYEELLRQMGEKMEEKRQTIRSLEAKLAEKKEEIKKLQSKLSRLHTYSELNLTVSEFEAFVNAYEKIGSNNVFSKDKKVTNEYWVHTSDGEFFDDLEEGAKVYILKKTIYPLLEEGE